MSEWESESEDEEEESSKVHRLVRNIRFGKCQYGYIKGPYYMVKPGPMPPAEHNKVQSKKTPQIRQVSQTMRRKVRRRRRRKSLLYGS